MSKKSNVPRKPTAPVPPKEIARKATASHSIPAPPPFHNATRRPVATPGSRTFATETAPFLLKSNARFKFLDINNLNSQTGRKTN
jgi:hypothetical protein